MTKSDPEQLRVGYRVMRWIRRQELEAFLLDGSRPLSLTADVMGEHAYLIKNASGANRWAEVDTSPRALGELYRILIEAKVYADGSTRVVLDDAQLTLMDLEIGRFAYWYSKPGEAVPEYNAAMAVRKGIYRIKRARQEAREAVEREAEREQYERDASGLGIDPWSGNRSGNDTSGRH